MTERLTKELIEQFISVEDDEFYVDVLRKKHDIAPDSSVFYTTISRMVDDKKIKRIGRGLYRKLKKIEPVKWWEADEALFYELAFPRAHDFTQEGVDLFDEDASSFGLENMVELSPNDLIVLSGVSNTGKSTFALNILAENVDKHPCVLMGNEYTTLDARPSPKFKRRMMKMNWVQWMNGNGKPKFDLLPVMDNYEDYIAPGKLNIVDWIYINEEAYKIGGILTKIKHAVGDGIAVVVLQKPRGRDIAVGGENTERFADLYMTLDFFGQETRLTVGKVKAAKTKVSGRMWAFNIVDSGAHMQHIREIVKCPSCYGKGYTKSGQYTKRCEACDGAQYIDKK